MERERDKTIGPDDAAFKRIPGVRRETFEKMPVIPEAAYTKLHSRGGKPPKLSVYDKLLISPRYLREYRTMEHIRADCGARKSAISDAIRRVEDTPVKDETFRLPGKKAPRRKTAEAGYLAADVTESPVQRPEKRQKRRYSGKKAPYDKDAGGDQPEGQENHLCSAGPGPDAWLPAVQGKHRAPD